MWWLVGAPSEIGGDQKSLRAGASIKTGRLGEKREEVTDSINE